MLDTKSLTFKQLEILKLSKGKHVVLAPPGSGKTQLGIPPNRSHYLKSFKENVV